MLFGLSPVWPSTAQFSSYWLGSSQFGLSQPDLPQFTPVQPSSAHLGPVHPSLSQFSFDWPGSSQFDSVCPSLAQIVPVWLRLAGLDPV